MLLQASPSALDRVEESDFQDLISSKFKIDPSTERTEVRYGEVGKLYLVSDQVLSFLDDEHSQLFFPGVALWRSDVSGYWYSVGTFWLQDVCQNHIFLERKNRENSLISYSSQNLLEAISKLTASHVTSAPELFYALDIGECHVIAHSLGEARGLLASEGFSEEEFNAPLQDMFDRGELFTVWRIICALTYQNRPIASTSARMRADRKAAKFFEYVQPIS